MIMDRLKSALRMCITRLRMTQQRNIALGKQARRAIAGLIESGRMESARIRVENIINDDIHIELLEILELYCELLLARIGLLEERECNPGLEEAVKSIMHAAPKSGIKELNTVRDMLAQRFGREFAVDAQENGMGKVAKRVLAKLSVDPPSPTLVELYLREIARAYALPFPGDDVKEEEEEAEEEAPISVSAPTPTTDDPAPKFNTQPGESLDDLTKRFNALKKI